MKKDIPEVPAMGMDETDAKAHVRKIKDWRVFYAQQPIVKLIVEKEELKALADELECELMDFAVAFPKSVHHLNDFKQGVPASTAYFCFHEDGDVILCGMQSKSQYDYLKAWKEIVLRTTGSGFTYFVAAPPTLKSELENADKLVKKYIKNRDASIAELNKIPGVTAWANNDNECPNEVICVTYPLNHINLVDSLSLDHDPMNDTSVNMMIDGTFEFDKYIDENLESSIHQTWLSEIKEVKAEDKNLTWLQEKLLELNKRLLATFDESEDEAIDESYDEVNEEDEEEVILDEDIVDKDKRYDDTDINDMDDPLN